MTTDNLDTLSDTQLNELFAVEVAGYTAHRGLAHAEFSKDKEWLTDAPAFSASSDLTVPWLEMRFNGLVVDWWRSAGTWTVASRSGVEAQGNSLARTLCIAGIRANRAASPTP